MLLFLSLCECMHACFHVCVCILCMCVLFLLWFHWLYYYTFPCIFAPLASLILHNDALSSSCRWYADLSLPVNFSAAISKLSGCKTKIKDLKSQYFYNRVYTNTAASKRASIDLMIYWIERDCRGSAKPRS